MGFPLQLLMTATPPPGGDLREGLDPDQVSPGLVGFIATLAVVLVTVLLILDMTRRVRRVRYRKDAEGPDAAGNDDASAGAGAGASRRTYPVHDDASPLVAETDDGPARRAGDDVAGPGGQDRSAPGFRGQNPRRDGQNPRRDDRNPEG